MSALGRWRAAALKLALGVDPRAELVAMRSQLAELSGRLNATDAELAAYVRSVPEWRERVVAWQLDTGGEIEYLRARAKAQAELAKRERDDIEGLRSRLDGARAAAGYDDAWTQDEPLISVRIASYNRPEQLVDVAIASVLRQSYQNFEIIVVSDGPSAQNRAAVEGVDDARIRYLELPARTAYPDERRNRWQVSGAACMNVGARAAKGLWIAPLDDDDEFSPDHLEKLLAVARAERAELAYGALFQRNLAQPGSDATIWSAPPVPGGFSFQGSIYLKAIGFFEYDEQSWLGHEPGDWNLIRRMMAAGVRLATTQEVLGVMNMVPYPLKSEQ